MAWHRVGPDGIASLVTILASTHGTDGVGFADLMLEAQEALPASPVIRVRVGRDGWTGSVGGERRVFPVLPGVGHNDAQVLQSTPLWWWPGVQGRPCWQFENAAGYLAVRAKIRERERAKAAARGWRRRRANPFAGDAETVNPYNFVSLRDAPVRVEPTTHLRLGEGRVSGRVDVRLTARSALALSGAGAGTQTDPYRPVVVDGRWVVPGSQFAGAVRSFHEALTDSCLRVIDLGYRPVHRDVATPQEPGRWRMAVVGSAGRAVRLCDPILHDEREYSAVWVEARHLADGPVDSTQLFHFDVAAAQLDVPHRRFRVERSSGAVPVRCTTGPGRCSLPHWRTSVTAAIDIRVLHPVGRQDPHHLPFALLPSGDAASGHVDLGESVLTDYQRSAEDSADVVARRRGDTPDLTVTGIGVRQETTAELTDGQVVWVRLTGGKIDRVTPSVLWRTPGEHSVKERVGEYRPCADPTSLCPSCRLFGMVEERESTADGPARVDAYRGHVRFGHGEVSDVETEPTRLREMGTPRPGAGQFYLDGNKHEGKQANRGERPLREWGSAADRPAPRRIRGRKFYWANSTGDRHEAGADAHEAMSSYHCLSPSGATVTFPVWFDNLTPVQLGSLLASLDPGLLRRVGVRERLLTDTGSQALAEALDHELLCLHLGKGKGLGLGAVSARLVAPGHDQSPAGPDPEATAAEGGPEQRAATGDRAVVSVWTEARYLAPGAEPRTADALGYVEEFVGRALADDQVKGWAPLLAMSALDWVPADHVAYPPDDKPGPDFRFDFWKRSTGAAGRVQIGNGPGATRVPPTLVVLPAADAQDVTVRRPWQDGEI